MKSFNLQVVENREVKFSSRITSVMKRDQETMQTRYLFFISWPEPKKNKKWKNNTAIWGRKEGTFFPRKTCELPPKRKQKAVFELKKRTTTKGKTPFWEIPRNFFKKIPRIENCANRRYILDNGTGPWMMKLYELPSQSNSPSSSSSLWIFT